MKMTKTERAELDKCTALAKKIRTAERLGVHPADIVRDASMLLTFERTMAIGGIKPSRARCARCWSCV